MSLDSRRTRHIRPIVSVFVQDSSAHQLEDRLIYHVWKILRSSDVACLPCQPHEVRYPQRLLMFTGNGGQNRWQIELCGVLYTPSALGTGRGVGAGISSRPN